MKDSYFKPSPKKRETGKISVSNRVRFGGNRNSYKSFKSLPLAMKLVLGGVLALLVFMLLLPLVSFENKKYDAQVAAKIERIHGQLAVGQFREVFLEGDRELVASYDEAEFTGKLARSQKFFAGNYEKTGSNSVHYTDLANRLKALIGKPALASSSYTFRADAGSGHETFYWIIRSDELKLADYEMTVRGN